MYVMKKLLILTTSVAMVSVALGTWCLIKTLEEIKGISDEPMKEEDEEVTDEALDELREKFGTRQK